jgi:hypothetical protein
LFQGVQGARPAKILRLYGKGYKIMDKQPAHDQLLATLIAAARAHHEFQTNILGGVRHSQWAGWYAAYLLGRLGEFTTPSQLTRWLEEVTEEKGWFKNAAAHISLKIKNN